MIGLADFYEPFWLIRRVVHLSSNRLPASALALAFGIGWWLFVLAVTPVWSGTVGEAAHFGSNPGQLRMFHYRPDKLQLSAPLVVALHGCQQTAVDYARQSGWTQQADRHGFLLLLPEQRAANNWFRCFNWFDPALIGRSQGEISSIRQMIAQMQSDYAIDSKRIYVTGLSAGGAMTAVLLATYPDVFAGGGIVAGVPYGCATGIFSAWRCQSWGRDLLPGEWAAKVYQVVAAANLKPTHWPRVSIWQGDSDWVVDSTNAHELAEQWATIHGLNLDAVGEEVSPGYTRRVYRDASGQPRIESYLITDMGHGQPITPGSDQNGCGIAADYLIPAPLCASEQIARFWGLIP